MPATVPPSGFSAFDDTNRSDSVNLSEKEAFGQFLSAARRRSGLSLEDVAATTKVAINRLQALEQGDIDQLPGGVYRRAWVKNYATAVGLSPDVAIERFDRMFAPPPAAVDARSADRHPAEPRPAVPARQAERQPRASAALAGAVNRLQQSKWVLPAVALIVAAVSVAALLRSAPGTPSASGDSTAPDGSGDTISGAAATRGSESRAADVMLTPEAPPTASVPHPGLVITSRPSGARVTVNGIGWGSTPITIRNLAPGPMVIRVTKDGYAGRETSVQFDQHATVRLILTPLN